MSEGGRLRRRAVRVGLTGFRFLPGPLRRAAVRAGTPHYTVGSVLVLTDPAGRVLLLRQRHHAGLTLPGGLLRRGEPAGAGVRREVAEEVGLDLGARTGLDVPATAVVDSRARRVDLVFAASLRGDPPALRPDREEAVEVCWVPVQELLRTGPQDSPATAATWTVLSCLAAADADRADPARHAAGGRRA